MHMEGKFSDYLKSNIGMAVVFLIACILIMVFPGNDLAALYLKKNRQGLARFGPEAEEGTWILLINNVWWLLTGQYRPGSIKVCGLD